MTISATLSVLLVSCSHDHQQEERLWVVPLCLGLQLGSRPVTALRLQDNAAKLQGVVTLVDTHCDLWQGPQLAKEPWLCEHAG